MSSKTARDAQPAAIRAEGITKTFGTVTAVADLDLVVQWGELYGFLGPNGAGKTTTIRMLNGLLRPTRGRVTIGGIDMAGDPIAAKRMIGYVPDRGYIYERLTGREFLAFVAGLYEMEAGDARSRIEELVELFSLGEMAEDLIGGYSHGNRQRLIFASSMLHRPRVVIIDEPMVGLDPRGARIVKDTLRRLAGEGAAVFISTHTLPVAEELCGRLGIINHGKLIAQGTLQELRERSSGGPGSEGGRDLESMFLDLTEPGAEAAP